MRFWQCWPRICDLWFKYFYFSSYSLICLRLRSNLNSCINVVDHPTILSTRAYYRIRFRISKIRFPFSNLFPWNIPWCSYKKLCYFSFLFPEFQRINYLRKLRIWTSTSSCSTVSKISICIAVYHSDHKSKRRFHTARSLFLARVDGVTSPSLRHSIHRSRGFERLGKEASLQILPNAHCCSCISSH